MCKYCHDDAFEYSLTGKNVLAEKDIFTKHVNYKWINFSASVSVCPDDKELKLWVDAGTDFYIIEAKKRIKYCPMCGREL